MREHPNARTVTGQSGVCFPAGPERLRAAAPIVGQSKETWHHMLKSYILTILCDDDICVGAAVFMDVINGFLDTVHHFNAHFQVTILCSE